MGKIIVSAPGKVILFGEHAVVYGKTAIAVSLNLRTRIEFEPCEDGIEITLPGFENHIKWSSNDLSQLQPFPPSDPSCPSTFPEEFLNKLKSFVGYNEESSDKWTCGQVVFLALFISISRSNGTLPGLKVHVSSELPIGAGLGSSAAFSVCLVVGLLTLRNVLPRDKILSEKGPAQIWSDSDLSLVNKWAFIAEQVVHGMPSGIDNSICTYGGAITFKQKKITSLCRKISKLKVLLVNTKIFRNTKLLVTTVREKYSKHPNVISHILESIDNIAHEGKEALCQLMQSNNSLGSYSKLEELMAINQPLLVSLGVSHPKLDLICHIASEHNLTAKLTGAGGGGFAFILIRPDASAQQISDLKESLEQEDFECWETAIGGPGVLLKTED